jgi:hypothetical protein
MKTFANRVTRSLAALTLIGTFSAAMTGAAYAGGQAANASLRSGIAKPGQLSPPVAAKQANGMSGSGSHARSVSPTPGTPHPANVVKPIIIPTKYFLQVDHVDAPGLYDLQASASAVTVKWYDRSDNELGFKVYRRDLSGNWQVVYQVATRNKSGSGTGDEIGGTDYTYVDTSTDVSGQCYMIAAYNDTTTGYTTEQCTVRPDPSQFPQFVGGAATQWSGLSNTNDGTGNLVNTNLEEHLLYGDQTWGVNLTYGDSSLWRVEAQGGPHLMKGQAVAIKVWGGGWLKYGNQTFGVDLQLSDTPVYEWYAIGLQNDPSERAYPGFSLTDGGTFALWNSSAQAYLVHGHQTWGVSLNWYKVGGGSPTPTPTPITQHGVKTERILNCSSEQDAVEVFIADQTTGGGYVDEGRIDPQYGQEGCPASGSVPITFSPQSGHLYSLVATDRLFSTCTGGDDPQDGGCQKMTAQFVGDANGFTRTDIVDDGVQITP